MTTIVVPTGLRLGPRYRDVEAAEPEPVSHEVALGDAAVLLGHDESLVLTAARADPARHARLAVTRRSVLDDCASAAHGGSDPDRRMDVLDQAFERLVRDGLLVEFDPVDGPIDELAALFRRYRLLPLAEGLGATAERPWGYRIGHRGTALLVVDAITYAAWAYARVAADLWTECCDLAAEAARTDLTPEFVARDVARNLPVLVSAGCGYLDLAAPGRDGSIVTSRS